MDYQEAISHFTEVTIHQVVDTINQKEKMILYLGRETCPYCRLFAPKLAEVSQDGGYQVSYLPSDSLVDLVAIQDFRARNQITTVPALLVASAQRSEVVCDSSLSLDAIRSFIEKGNRKK
ncbi:bacterocin transport accessory protein [Streptococcus pseudoporcinus]|uniref:Bacterocin transport accessory protein n=1 Tax=Streptococcus pseudoporcinus TaxID=361101 RepID=A0A4U9XI89_9STRE|nr:conjugal transfer protein TraF [Streptococcus pseudoporcinus]VTS12492.1 bacterocin transport accessory protein [Streptococcus pseudoporcinus]VTS39434.1 bacterocin transport accessory protein [Streptococcus pseudoporcinus]VUC65046.1 bacterocin transport accessory protein [Streptococcus pseudoporcinus]VUC95758.1 bacterocin transport accessory protein [Streptococcus pseudoporcinus]VUC96151.1 bacterocin transport accessory protein [Streptococcus pseudoporcinus]